MQKKMEQWYLAAGAIQVVRRPMTAPGVSTHSHEAPNLGLLGASVMGTSGAHNPTLTVHALSWRTAEYLVKNWKAISG
ncbi:MAG: hypothetical protein JJE04_02260 [Acidobacteriia bacterium]|nr:hypothetical protein [Terriglobia bacterium]